MQRLVFLLDKADFVGSWNQLKLYENASETRVVYSTSQNGKDWSAPKTLAETLEIGCTRIVIKKNYQLSLNIKSPSI
jgi:hypothetical protein